MSVDKSADSKNALIQETSRENFFPQNMPYWRVELALIVPGAPVIALRHSDLFMRRALSEINTLSWFAYKKSHTC